MKGIIGFQMSRIIEPCGTEAKFNYREKELEMCISVQHKLHGRYLMNWRGKRNRRCGGNVRPWRWWGGTLRAHSAYNLAVEIPWGRLAFQDTPATLPSISVSVSPDWHLQPHCARGLRLEQRRTFEATTCSILMAIGYLRTVGLSHISGSTGQAKFNTSMKSADLRQWRVLAWRRLLRLDGVRDGS